MRNYCTILRVCCAATLAVCVALPGITWAKIESLEKYFGQPSKDTPIHFALSNEKLRFSSSLTGTDNCEVPPEWRKPFRGAGRFVAVLNGAAYCDQETGLVWEAFPAGNSYDWAGAVNHCATREVGARKGWSLPSREHLASLVDINSGLCIGGGLCLPDGHPFQDVQSANYWSSSTTAGSPAFAWLVNFFFGGSFVINLNGDGLAWCTHGS